jgi:hypothetical protein
MSLIWMCYEKMDQQFKTGHERQGKTW